MVSSNKILTVSYGTFSCTLEGFDNSFDTMKAIAEYFRDLAQDDRYFGAEPPTPDAEMLARIAEREIARRVEARFEKGNLVLRPSDDAEPPRGDVAPQSSKDAALADATASVAATALAVAAQPADAQAVSTDTFVEDDIEIDISEMEFADLEAVADSEEDNAPEDDGVTIDLSDISLDTDDVDAAAFSADDVLDAEETAIAESSIDDLIAAQDDKENRRIAAEAAEAEVAPVVADSVAEKLQRIRAVVASKAQPAPEYIEDEHAMSGPDGDGNDENNAIDVEETTALDDNLFTDTIAAVVSDQLDLDDEDDEEAFLPDTDFDDEDDEDYAPVAARRDDAQSELEILRAKIAELEAQAAAARASETVAVEQAEQPDVIAQQDEDDDEDDLDLMSDDEDDDELFADDEEDDSRDKPYVLQNTVMDDDETDEEEAAAPQPLIARVGKAKRADVEAALASGQLEEYDDEDEDDAPVAVVRPVPGLEDSSLTPEQEAELARELADLHAEIEEDEDWDFDDEEDDFDHEPLSEADEEAASANIRKAVKLTSPGRAMLTDTSIEEDTDSVERLVGKTDSAMEEPEGNRRRNAIAHLRAAVAATKADRILGFGKKTVNEEQPYREDLADAVRPRRPKVTEARSARPAPVRPAPLKLVAEQRIDVDGEKAATPVRPRRVMRNVEQVEAADAKAGDDTGFAEFAENQGAHTLPELLEAAAAYMSFVEGRDQFSRPQLMTKLLQAEGAASSREERLRSFGQLLREGKIEKKSGGRFAASDSIGFKPDARAAG
ncbi:hypothetical protein [Marivita sp.]|uniref:hypothetical protein n=1 Tax=Marivita sp. TaxID=2003365 RepID=UPI0025C61F7A|nr:hypothetical protein [Marivita sp.]